MTWITLRAALKALKQQGRVVSSEHIKTLLAGESPEDALRELGLLFNRTAYQQNNPKFLQLVQSASDKPKSESPKSQSTPRKTESPPSQPALSYAWKDCPIKLLILIQPADDDGQRQAIISATTYEDAPLIAIENAADLQWPASILQLLKQLKHDLPTRKHLNQSTHRAKNTQLLPSAKPETNSNSSTHQVNLFS
ncbi:MAG: hypothetical protein QNJ46_24935 [Leptolyngbyaceae cyanobacterium MO_188.B28]|nr:hypothetical protein [Leptolyngbyaceae cyanobacterium MO_188.B28]